MLWEVYEEWFEHKLSRRQWRELVLNMPGMNEFRTVMFSRLIPNLRQIGLLPERMLEHYDDAGLLKYVDGKSALEMDEQELVDQLDSEGTVLDHHHDHDDHHHHEHPPAAQ
jgi:hypothetical protein